MASTNSLSLTEPEVYDFSKGGPDIEKYANTFIKAQETGLQRQRLEAAIAEANMKALESESEHKLQMSRMALDTAFKMADDKRADKIYQMQVEDRNRDNNRLEDKQRQDLDRRNEIDQQTDDYVRALATIDDERGTAGYEKKVAEIGARFPRGAQSRFGMQAYRDRASDHNLSVRRAIDANTAAWKNLGYEVGTTIWGDKNNWDLAPLFNANFFEPITRHEYPAGWKAGDPLPKEKRTATPGTGDERGQTKESANYVGVRTTDAQGKPGPPRRVAVEDVIRLKQQYQELIQQKHAIPPQINNPNAGVEARATDSSFNSPTQRQRWEQGMRDQNLTPVEKAKLEKLGRKNGWM